MRKKESTNWSFKICALSGSLDGSDDDKIMCIRYGPCKDLLERLTSLEDTDVDPFEEIPEDEVCLEDVPEQWTQIILMKMRMLLLTKCIQTYEVASKIFVL